MSVPATLRVPSLKPKRLRGVCASGVVDEVLPKPSCDQRIAIRPKPIRARLRIACTATCGSSAHAWTHRSPPLRAGSRLSPGNFGRSTRASGLRSASEKRSARSLFALSAVSAVSAVNRVGPKPMVSVSRDGWRPIASPVSSGGASGSPPNAPSPTARPSVISAAAAVQSFRSWISSARSSVVTSKAAKCSRSGTAVAMPAWCAPWKGTAAPAEPAGSVPSVPRSATAAPPPRRRPARARHRPSRSPNGGTAHGCRRLSPQPWCHRPSCRRPGYRGWFRRSWRFGYFTTAAASFDSGSASAFTASDSSLRCGSPTLSYEVNS